MIKRIAAALGVTALLLLPAAPAGATEGLTAGHTFGPYLWCLQAAQQECVGSNGDGNAATIRLTTYAKLTLTQLLHNGKPTIYYLVTNAGGQCLRTTGGSLSPIFSSGACGTGNNNAIWELFNAGTAIYRIGNQGFQDYAVTYYTTAGSRLYQGQACCGNYWRWHFYKG